MSRVSLDNTELIPEYLAACESPFTYHFEEATYNMAFINVIQNLYNNIKHVIKI